MSNSDNKKNVIDRLLEIPRLVWGWILFISLLTTTTIIIRDNFRLVLLIILESTLIVAFLSCLHIIFAKKPPSIETPPTVKKIKWPYRYERYRTFAIYGFFATLIVLTGQLLIPSIRGWIITGLRGSLTPSATATSNPTSTITWIPILTYKPSIASTSTSTVSPTSTPEPSPLVDATTIAISEVMFDACGPAEIDRTDEYVELFNYGNHPIDLQGYWITNGYPQRIVPWSNRNPYVNIPGVDEENLSTWVLNPGKFAIVLAPNYLLGNRPYQIPLDTIILTIDRETGDRFGGPLGFVGSLEPIENRDILILYIGSLNHMDTIISTYGTPIEMKDYPDRPNEDINRNPWLVSDNGLDEYPIYTDDCRSVERKELSLDDSNINWHLVYQGSFGGTPTPTPLP